MPRRSVSPQLTAEQTRELDRWIKVGSTPQQVALRARIVRQAAGGESDKQIAQALKVHPRTAALLRRRALVEGIACIWEIAAGRGRKPKFGATTVSEWIDPTLQTKPRGASHWSPRSFFNLASAYAAAISDRPKSLGRLAQIISLLMHLNSVFTTLNKNTCTPQ